MNKPLNRRNFLSRAGALGAVATFGFPAIGRAGLSPNAKLNIGVIGTSGRAQGNIEGVQGENIVAVCDIDDNLLDQAGQRFCVIGHLRTGCRYFPSQADSYRL